MSKPHKAPVRPTGRNQLRIIGGEYRRRIIHFPNGDGLRPSADRVRETLFNWLGQELHGLSCLDLFAGAGGLGFEAASRGARRVMMVEQSRQALAMLKENQQQLKAGSVEIVAGDALALLARCREQFDVVFVDPPFASDLLQKVLPLLPAVLREGALVYVETAHWPELVGWQVVKQGKAGVVHYGLLQLVPTAGDELSTKAVDNFVGKSE